MIVFLPLSLSLSPSLSAHPFQEGLHPLQTMDEMQCMWFQTEMAMAHWRLGQLGEALVKLHEIDKVYSLSFSLLKLFCVNIGHF